MANEQHDHPYYQATRDFIDQHPEVKFNPREIDFSDFDEHARERISRNLMAFRRSLGLSQESFATILNTSRSQYRKYESGAETIRLDIAMRVSLRCGLPLFHLLAGSKYEPYVDLHTDHKQIALIWFYANSVNDEYFEKLCQILLQFSNADASEVVIPPSNLSAADFEKADKENKEDIYIAIGEGIRAVRHHFELSQERIANLMGVSINTYQEYEKASQRPRFNILASARYVTCTGVHAFVPLCHTYYAKIRFMQNSRVGAIENILCHMDEGTIERASPMIEGFYQMVKEIPGSLLFEI